MMMRMMVIVMRMPLLLHLQSFSHSNCPPLSWTNLCVGVSLARFPDPLAFGSGSGLQCVYTVVISLWGTPAPTFLLEPPKTLFYWIPLCFRKPQAEFQKFSSTHGSPSDRFISSPRSPLLVGIKDEEYLSIWSLYFFVHVSFHFFVDHLP